MSVYKAEKSEYLNRALQSVWDDQTHKPNEVVLVADGPLTPDLDKIIDGMGNEIKLNTGKTYVGFVADQRWEELVIE